MPRGDPCRRPGVADGLILIVSLAVAFAMVKRWEHPNWSQLPLVFGPSSPSPAHLVLQAISTRISWTIPFAITTTPTLLILRLRRPRPSLRGLARQPGAVACAAASLAMALRMAEIAFGYLLNYLVRPSSLVRLPSPPFRRWPPAFEPPSLGQVLHNIVLESFPFMIASTVCIAVIVAWTLLWASGRRRAERSWLDRVGRLLGWYWIALGVSICVLSELWKNLL